MSKRKRILIWVGASLGVLGAYLWLFGIQTLFALQAWNTARQVPEVRAVPVNITDTSLNQATGTKLSYSTYSFEIPWADIDQSQSKTSDKKQILFFRSGIRILASSVPPREFVSSVAQKAGGEDILRRDYGEQVVSSDYNFYRAMLNTTPRAVSPFGSREAAVRNLMLLTIKAIAMPDPGRSGVYSFHTAGFQGFQYGTPGNTRRMVITDLLDDTGAIEFILFDVKDQSPRVTQADINRITQSLVRISTTSTSASMSPANAKLEASK